MSTASKTRLTGHDVPTSLPSTEEEMAARAAGTDLAGLNRTSNRYDETELRGITSFDDALRLADEKFGGVESASKIMGTGFSVLDTSLKQTLIGVTFIILSMDFNEGDQGPFVSLLVVDRDGRRYVVNDGSTGIYAQCEEYAIRTGDQWKPLRVDGGLRKSEYDKVLDNGEVTHAVTYYLNV